MTRAELESFVTALAPVLKEFVAAELKPILESTIALNTTSEAHAARLNGLEQRKSILDWCGPWRAGQAYTRGDLVSSSGGLWLAVRDSSEKPRGDPSGWKLIVQKGDLDR